jgi:uncharacterized radical SAM superfamily Fe-S cluster-containing enzyme
MRLEEKKPLKLEEAGKVKGSVKFIRIPLIIHTVLKRENSFSLQIEHVKVKRTSINIPRDAVSLKSEEIEDYIKQVYPNAQSFIIQYEERDGKLVPFCAQLFLVTRGRYNRRI